MKRLILILALLASTLTIARAQNNPYSIDDVCFEYFNMAEALVYDLSNDAFDIANDALLKRAQEVGDSKARTLYWVERLKRTTRIARSMDNRADANKLIDQRRKEALTVARETGYMQYFYYAYELSQNYYVNTNQYVQAQKLLNEMLNTATKEKDEYGLWQSQRYLSILYLRQNDLLNARKYLRNVVEIHSKTDNPTIRRQSLTRQCCDLADTYHRGSDSARFYYNMAEKTAILHNDTVRVAYYKAQLAALDHQLEKYRQLRDYCLADYGFLNQLVGGDLFFACVDAIVESKPREEVQKVASKINSRQQMIFLRDLAISYSRENVTAWLGTRIILILYSDISYLNNLKMEEISSVMESSKMQAEMDRQKKRITLLFVHVGVLAAALLGLIAGIIITKRRKKQ